MKETISRDEENQIRSLGWEIRPLDWKIRPLCREIRSLGRKIRSLTRKIRSLDREIHSLIMKIRIVTTQTEKKDPALSQVFNILSRFFFSNNCSIF
ncbi:MAG: hypothetical protein ACJ8GL_00795 [Bacillus sp. (in: firmicutes)]